MSKLNVERKIARRAAHYLDRCAKVIYDSHTTREGKFDDAGAESEYGEMRHLARKLRNMARTDSTEKK